MMSQSRSAARFRPDVMNVLLLGLTLTMAAFLSGCVGASGAAESSTGGGFTALPGSIAFGNVNTGSSSTRSVVIANTSSADVSVANVSITGAGFNVSGVPAGTTISPGKSGSLSVSFAPSSAAAVSGSVTITSKTSADALVIALSGTGVTAGSHSVTLTWNASTSSVSGYRAYRATTQGGPYTALNSAATQQLRYVDSTVQPGTTYYYVVTAVAPDSTESVYSNQGTGAVPK